MASFSWSHGLPTNQASPRRRNSRWTTSVIVTIVGCIFFLWVMKRMLFGSSSAVETPSKSQDPPSQHQPPYSPLKEYQSLEQPPLITSQAPSAPSKRAVITTLYSDNFAEGVAVLGHSISQAKVSARLIVLYIEERLSAESLCTVKTAGWTPVAVPRIPPPHNGEGVYWRFSDQYTKLNIWGLDHLGDDMGGPVEQAVYLDADTLVLQNFDELFETRFNFAAVPDIYGDERGFSITFNAGVLVLRPSTAVFETMKGKLEVAEYPLEQAEQAFLNLFFGGTTLRLPYAYNANLAIKGNSPKLWKDMLTRKEMKIVHYTLAKPWDAYDPNGFYADEVSWWIDVRDDMVKEMGSKLELCHHLT